MPPGTKLGDENSHLIPTLWFANTSVQLLPIVMTHIALASIVLVRADSRIRLFDAWKFLMLWVPTTTAGDLVIRA